MRPAFSSDTLGGRRPQRCAARGSGRAPPSPASDLGGGLCLDQRSGDTASPGAASGAEFRRCTGAQEQPCLPGESGTESFPRRKSRGARVEPQGTRSRPQQSSGEVGRGGRRAGGRFPEPLLGVCLHAQPRLPKLQRLERRRGFLLPVCRSPRERVRSEEVAPALSEPRGMRLMGIALFLFWTQCDK